ncbi:MAG TPA: hypothetical protein DCG34_08875 [Clostridiales bacterium]|jgi:hypothetical protein|nr:hypothetical protein [Clostridiales bacterium]
MLYRFREQTVIAGYEFEISTGSIDIKTTYYEGCQNTIISWLEPICRVCKKPAGGSYTVCSKCNQNPETYKQELRSKYPV